MKFIFTFSLIILFSFQLIAQQKTLISAGAGFSLFDNNKDRFLPSLLGFNIQVEKPFNFLDEKPVFISVRPGLNYNRISEMYKSEALGGWYEYKSIHKAISVNSKMLIGTKNVGNELILYGGLNLGVYLWSETIKTLNKKNISILDGNIFFNSSYYGFLFGIGPNISDSFVIPTFEFSFFPNFANTQDSKRNAFQFSVIIGINKINNP